MKLFRRLRALFRKEKLDAEMTEELCAHLELQAAENEKRGMSADEACYAAHRVFGGVEQIKERVRDQRHFAWLEQLLQDLRYATRQLRKAPGVTAVAVLSLALGIGANTAVFSLVNAVLLQMLPVKTPEQLVLFNWRAVENVQPADLSGYKTRESGSTIYTCTSFSPIALEAFRANASTLSSVFGFVGIGNFKVNNGEQTEVVSGQFATGNYHQGMEVGIAAGRLITVEDDKPDAEPVAVISDRYWQRRFGGDPRTIGKVITINQSPVTIVGVTAAGFNGALQVGNDVDVTLPLGLISRLLSADHGRPETWFLRIMGRMKPGATIEQTRASLEGVFRGIARGQFEIRTQSGAAAIGTAHIPLPQLGVLPGGQGLLTEGRSQYDPTLRLLIGISTLVLLVACANVANLLLARGAARRREFAVRLALGASRTRVVRQLLVESVLLAALGALTGLVLAWWGARALLLLQPFGPDLAQIETPLDWRVLGFATAVAVTTGIVFGLVPALRSTRLNLTAEFQGGARAMGGSRSKLARTLMIVQVALSVVLLVGAGLLVRTLRNLHRVDVGFDRECLLLFELGSPGGWRAPLDSTTTIEPIRQRLAALPGVHGATYEYRTSFTSWTGSRGVVYVREAKIDGVGRNEVDLSYLGTLEIPLLRGRNFGPLDSRQGAPPVAIVNQAFAKRVFGTEDVVGQRFAWDSATGPTVEIVGVMRDARYSGLKGDVPPFALTPYPRWETALDANFIVRFSGSEAAVMSGALAAIREFDPNLPVTNVRTEGEQIDRLFSRERFFTTVCGTFGMLALVLAAVGLYGLMSYQVLRRTGEIGVRMALGALPAQVLRMVLRESLILVAVGVLIGVAAALGATRWIASLLFGVPAHDPVTYGGIALLLLAVAVVASLLPARRAAKVDPMVALRCE
jgi:predicted permease